MFPILEAAYGVIESKDGASCGQYWKKVERIFIKYGEHMYLAAMSVLQNHHDAEDAVQDTFISIASIMDRVPDPDDDGAEVYFCKAAKNHAISKLRGEAPKISLDNIGENIIKVRDFADDITDDMADDELYEEILEYIKSMDDRYVDVLTMRYLFNMTPAEIAVSLGKPVNTVKSQLKRAIFILNRRFGSRKFGVLNSEKKRGDEIS